MSLEVSTLYRSFSETATILGFLLAALAIGCAPDLALGDLGAGGAGGGGGGSGGNGGSGAGGQGPEGGIPVWSRHFGGTADQTGPNLAIDSGGDTVLLGELSGSIELDRDTLVSVGAEDLLLARLDEMGDTRYSMRFGDANPQFGHAVAIDGNDEVLVAGEFSGNVDFGGPLQESAGGRDCYLAKLDAAGAPIWINVLGGIGYQAGVSVATDSEGNVLIAGRFTGTVSWGQETLESAGSYDLFVAKLDPDGNFLWSRRFGDGYEQRSSGVAVDAMGNVFLLGEFAGTLDFGGELQLESAGDYDIFVAKLDADGNPIWAKRFGDAGPQAARSLAVDGAGSVVIAGELTGTVDFGDGPRTASEGVAVFAAKLDAAGSPVWSKVFGESGSSSLKKIAVDGAGNVLLAGEFTGGIDFGSGVLESEDAEDVFVVKLDVDGRARWSQRFGGPGSQRASGVAVDVEGHALVTGTFRGSVDLGGESLESDGNADIFLVKLTF